MKERLTYRVYEQVFINDLDICGIGEKNAEALDKANWKLFEYEEKEEQGLLLELPCKIGTPVYFIDEDWKYKDEEFDLMLVIKKIPFSYSMIPYVGTSYYLTKEEAEVALNKQL